MGIYPPQLRSLLPFPSRCVVYRAMDDPGDVTYSLSSKLSGTLPAIISNSLLVAQPFTLVDAALSP